MQIKKISFLFVILWISTHVHAQIDTNKKVETGAFSFEVEEENKENKTEITTSFGSLSNISNNFSQYSIIPIEKPNDMRNQVDKDVLVKKYWDGKDVSDVKLKTKVELGTLETTGKSIVIECRDHSYVDGDRVSIYVNEELLRANIILQAGYYTINIVLKDGFNRIDIKALNQGSSGPNTAEFRVIDDKGSVLANQEWNILTGYVATLVVVKN